jgi:hypothetical protein
MPPPEGLTRLEASQIGRGFSVPGIPESGQAPKRESRVDFDLWLFRSLSV